MNLDDDQSDRLIALTTELVAWTRFQNRQALRDVLARVLTTENDLAIYELTDGTNSQEKIADAVGVTQSAVSRKWTTWRELGLLWMPGSDTRSWRHLASIKSLGGLPPAG